MRSFLLLTVLSLGVMACDETDPDSDVRDSERIIGTWDASSASVRVRNVPVPVPVTNDLAAADDAQTFAFSADGTFAFAFVPQSGRRLSLSFGGEMVSFPLREVRIAGVYTLNETTRQITFSTIPNRTEDDFRFGYDFDGGTLNLDANNSTAFVRLFGILDEDAGRLAGVIDGGRISYRQGGA